MAVLGASVPARLSLTCIALALLIASAVAQSSLDAVADALFAQHQSEVGLMNGTAFEGLYHTFLGGTPEHPEDVVPPACEDAETVFALYDADADSELNRTEFGEALSTMIAAKSLPCELPEEGTAEEEDCQNSKKEAWGYAFLATIIVSLLSLIGALLWLITKTVPRIKRLLTNFMIAFAIGTLMGDAILHILPHMWDLHGHNESGEEEETSHGHSHGSTGHVHHKWEELKFIWPGLVTLGTIVAFYVLELVIGHVVGYSHSHDDIGKGDELDEHHMLPESTAWLNLAVEVVHNFLDGIAIGAAFSSSNSLGVSTAIAVGAHELPQELADFVLLCECGFSVKKALLLNLLASLTALIGVCVGVAAGTKSQEAQTYLLAFAAGGFLYIALVNMMPSLNRMSVGKNRIWMLAAQLVGMLLGFAVLLIIAIYEPEHSC